MIVFLFLSVLTGFAALGFGVATGVTGVALLLWYVTGCWCGVLVGMMTLAVARTATQPAEIGQRGPHPVPARR